MASRLRCLRRGGSSRRWKAHRRRQTPHSPSRDPGTGLPGPRGWQGQKAPPAGAGWTLQRRAERNRGAERVARQGESIRRVAFRRPKADETTGMARRRDRFGHSAQAGCRVETERPHPALSEKWLKSRGASASPGARRLHGQRVWRGKPSTGCGTGSVEAAEYGQRDEGTPPSKRQSCSPTVQAVDEEGSRRKPG